MKRPEDLKIPFSWQDRKPVLLEKFLYIPSQYEDHASFGLGWLSEIRSPLVLECCSGNGQWIAAQAMHRPDLHFLAVEYDFHRARQCWLKIFRHKLPNLWVVCGEALTFLRHYLPSQCLTEAYVNFPDPWPKRRHASRRLIQKNFVEALGRVLLPKAPAMIVTDDAPYSGQIVEQFLKDPVWTSDFASPYFVTDWPSYGTSYFYDLWNQKQRTIRYHRFCHD